MKRIISAGDAATAKLIDRAGFDGIWVSSFECSTRMGVPDDGKITLRQMVDIVRPISLGVSLPVFVDVDTGYGDFRRTVRMMEDIGVAGVCVKDTTSPQNSLWQSGGKLLNTLDFISKISMNCNLKVIARTEALVLGYSKEDTLELMARYAEFADMVIPHAVRREQIIEKPKGWGGKPWAIIPSRFENLPHSYFEAIGYDMVIWANQMERVKLRAAKNCLASIRDNDGAVEIEKFAITLEQMRGLT